MEFHSRTSQNHTQGGGTGRKKESEINETTTLTRSCDPARARTRSL